ncbi:tannase/feruloyl esterase family alpha/beta hydrolase [Shewanella sp. SG44-2]|uniref:tannase/feruloyl esterase family alpha/beta hydrolase n=1 Tax=Shewanella sp. SG44-2 TaxID=2760962 RepID=UPI001601EA2B|nr:tannase/feruloyl esterase family alpha/beta hydrolase [Shewanella sp. SG44-2]MBB1425682.1 tannase/feruloyl esterase family alpha/beta hydrolase [Shewanella sp. SG44-2]
MKTENLWVPLALAPLCIALYGCNSDSPTKTVPQLEAATPASIISCATLTTEFNYADTTITSAELIPAGDVEYAAGEIYPSPSHCLIKGLMNERTGIGMGGDADYAIGFEMRLPSDWNGRFYYQANGGLDGSVQKAVGRFLISESKDSGALNKGFAVISSDTGHASPAPLFGMDPQARLDYGYNAVAELTPMAKSLIETAYGKQPDRSYFGGCSNGGRHTMVAATRYADLYDGFLVGNPGFNLPKAAVSQVYGIQQYSSLVNVDADNVLTSLQSSFTQEEFALVSNKVAQQCDALDGASDGMVQDTYGCQDAFDLARDVPTCSADRDGTCLTAAQKSVMTNIMSGPHNSNTDEAIYSDFPYDAGMGTSDYYGWEFFMAMMRDPGALAFIFSTAPTPYDSSELGSYEYVMSLDMDTDIERIYNINDTYTESGMEFMTPPNPTDLTILRDRGAKMMVVHGTSDAVFSPNDTVNWYKGLQDVNENQADEFARLYLVPGMNHCGNGLATDRFDMLDSLVEWVEQGQAPESIKAAVRSENTELPANWSKTRTRPLCPFPQVATYSGTGDMEEAINFTCVTPK